MSEIQSGCKVPIGTAYQKPLSRDQTYEESFWQSQLLRERLEQRRELRGNILCAIAWGAMIIGLILLTP
ncbi:MAG: hypothetical protein ACO3GP_05975 [Candidatus Limnocylindrus sp.]